MTKPEHTYGYKRFELGMGLSQ